MRQDDTPVLIAGGSIVGLSAALFLASHGIKPVLVERHRGISQHPRAMGLSPRSMEILRAVGLEEALRKADPIEVVNSGILHVETLAGREVGWIDTPSPEDISAISPTTWLFAAQDNVEPVIRDRAAELGADIRFHAELESFERATDGTGIVAVVRDHDRAERYQVRARYLLAADGHRSPVRDRLGIALDGPGTLGSAISVLFRADLSAVLRGRRFAVCYIENAQVQGVLAAYDSDRWALGIGYRPEAGETPADFTDDRCAELVRAATGVADLGVELLAVIPWELAAQVARRFQEGEVFLAGDSAHVTPPTGAFGANTGIQDAHNLAWKLAAVLSGAAGPGLLASYDTERRAVGRLTVEQAMLRGSFRDGADGPPPTGILDDLAVMLGYRYGSAPAQGKDGQPCEARHPRDWSGEPGTRAPHVVLVLGGRSVSTLDLCTGRLVLLAGPEGTAWAAAARQEAARLGVALDGYVVGDDLADADDHWCRAFGVTRRGAVLVRPDGFVGWRCPSAADAPAAAIRRALESVLHRVAGPEGAAP